MPFLIPKEKMILKSQKTTDRLCSFANKCGKIGLWETRSDQKTKGIDDMKEHIGRHIAHYRKKAGMTQEQLAEKMGVTSQAVSKWENGLTCPDLDSVAELAGFLGVAVEQLIHGDAAVPTVQVVETPQVGKRVLCIRVHTKLGMESNTTVRFPVELILKAYEMGNLEGLLGEEAAFVEQAIEMIRQGTVGSVVDVDTEQATVRIEVVEV